ncbi:hypothetical protein GWI33_021829 [Rhynchophorus ferrugineus]|uniref:RRM domain-containing protein n=1 Tax=Rhynchophorus ferrugineus TaxID=354439 RepID=A0A834MJF1_RHYFE|nr:hypothetical protein GWI33_021829 [Rhynchophorus ferrugineus]
MDSKQGVCNMNFKIEQKGRQRVLVYPSRECPSRGTEVYVKNLPRHINVLEILSFMQQCGLVYCVRLIMDFSGFNKGYCYVSYLTEDSAKIATLVLNETEIIPSYILYIKMSYDNNKLLLRGIPWNITYSELNEDVLPAIKNGLTNISWKPWIGKKKDCLLEYGSHRQALEARKCIWPSVSVWKAKLKIGWAKNTKQSENKYIYFHNLQPTVTRFELCIELLKILNIHLVAKIEMTGGKGYIAFSSERHRTTAFKKLKGHFFLGRIINMEIKPLNMLNLNDSK